MHKRLDVWRESMELVTDVYRITRSFPDFERFGLAQQLQRTAVSIPSNIAEGMTRQSQKATIQFLYISSGSCAEVETQLLIAKNLGYTLGEAIFCKFASIRKMLNGLVRHKKSNPQSPIPNPQNQKETF